MWRWTLVLLAACGSDPAVAPDAAVEVDAPAIIDASDAAALSVEPATHDFGNAVVGLPRPLASFVISNHGTIAAPINSIALGGAAPADFNIESNDCPLALLPEASCTVVVKFTPTAPDARTALLGIMSTEVVTAALGGRGLDVNQRLVFSPGSRNLGDVAVGAEGEAFTFAVLNESAASHFTAAIVGPGAAAFRVVSTDCTTGEIPLHGTCSITAVLDPSVGGQFSANLQLTDDRNVSWFAGLYGTSSTPFLITPYTGFFGSVLLGQAEPGNQVTFTITNTSDAATGTIATSLIGAAAADFTIRSTTCTTLVGHVQDVPDDTCNVVVELTPASRGAKTAQLAVTDTATTTSVRSTLRGDAYSLFLSGTSVFANTAQGQTSVKKIFKVLNASDHATGPIATTVGGVHASQFSIATDGCQAGIPAHNQCIVELTFSPTSTGLKTANLQVTASPGGSDSRAISGSGI